MRAHRTSVLPLLVSGLIAAGCAIPQPLVRLNPDAAGVVWVAGRASVQQAQDGIRVAAAFEHQDGKMLALRLEVHNGTPARLEVDPTNITFSTCRTSITTTCRPSQRVIDPEQMLLAVDAAESRNAADAVNTQVALGTLALLSAAGDVAQAASGHGDQTTGEGTAAAVSMMDDAAAAADTQQASLAVQRQVWSDQALRRNTLFPGQGTDGLVYVPIDSQAGFVWVQAMIGGHTFPFHFAQVITPVVATPPAAHSPTENR
jgi:hypothetical protein